MAVEILAMATIVTNEFTLGAGADALVAVATPDDGDTSYIANSDTLVVEQYTVANPVSVDDNDTISNVAIVVRYNKQSGISSTVIECTAIVGGDSTSTNATAVANSTYTNRTVDFATAPGGGAWTAQKVRDLNVKIREVTAVSVARVTTLTVEVTYTAIPRPQVSCLMGVG